MFSLRNRLTLSTAALLFAGLCSPLESARAQSLNFDDVATNAAGFNSAAFNSYQGYTFENFGVLKNTSTFGTGNNASSPANFAYAQADGSSFIYRTDIDFSFYTANLSFRHFDLDASPAMITVRGYRAGDVNASYTKSVQLTSVAQQFTFNFNNIEELEFETDFLQSNGRSAVLALDDVGIAVVPEPASIALVAAGLAAIVLAGRRRVLRGA